MSAEQGADFWRTADRCADIPADGLIEQRSACYVAAGDPRYWRREATGHGDGSEWTNTTSAPAPSNFARWLLRSPAPDRLRLEVYVAGGEATAATYQIVHAGVTDTVVIDQSAASGFVTLGEFDVDGNGDEYVQLGDHTGTSGQKLVVDALLVTSLVRGFGGSTGSEDGGCTTSGGTSLASALLALLAVRRRRR
jgi:uncharacterized protein (TIGR03382 family)